MGLSLMKHDLGLSFSSKLDWASSIVFIAKSGRKKTGALIVSR